VRLVACGVCHTARPRTGATELRTGGADTVDRILEQTGRLTRRTASDP
jgi:hypothetical protein